jgi:RNA polymerase sporulation-specific sigma factor
MAMLALQVNEQKLINQFRSGDRLAFNELLQLYTPTINSIARGYYCGGMTKSDFFQEGSLGLYKALIRYDQTKAQSFKRFAIIHIKNRMINALKMGNRQKQQHLNNGVSLYTIIGCDGDQILAEFLISDELTPEEKFMNNIDRQEKIQQINRFLRKLTEMEKGVLLGWVNNLSYQIISVQLEISTKSVDNAISRIKQKIKELKAKDGNLL